MTTTAQNRAIHGLKNKISGLDDDAYRALLSNEFCVRSSRDLTEFQADRLIARLKRLSGQNSARASHIATGSYAPILRALWLAAWNLGVARSNDDRALIAFVQRQTGLEHTRFLIDFNDARRAIEALKKWLEREAQVKWPSDRAPLLRKRAVIAAQTALIRTHQAGFDPAFFGALKGLPRALDNYGERQLDRLSEHMGALVRQRKEARHVDRAG